MATRPDDLSGVVLWLRADQGLYQDTTEETPATADGDAVAVWADLSGKGNDVGQADGSKRPALKLGVAGGRPAVRFDGTNDELVGASAITPQTVLAVARIDTAGSVVLGMGSIDGYEWFGLADDRLRISDGMAPAGSLDAPHTAGQWGVLAGSIAGSGLTSALHVDGERLATSTALLPRTGTMIVGARADSGSRMFLAGDIAEVIAYDRVLSGPEWRAIEDYLAARYGIPIAHPPALVVGSMPVPVILPDGAQVEEEEIADRARTVSGVLRSVRIAQKRRWRIRTTLMPRPQADALRAELLSAPPITCAGAIVGDPVECVPELLSDTIQRYADGQRVAMDFMLHEV